jgi:hypothetical protein
MTAALAIALDQIMQAGGRMHRHVGGRWSKPGEQPSSVDPVTNMHVHKLLQRGDIICLQRNADGDPIAVKLNSRFALCTDCPAEGTKRRRCERCPRRKTRGTWPKTTR